MLKNIDYLIGIEQEYDFEKADLIQPAIKLVVKIILNNA